MVWTQVGLSPPESRFSRLRQVVEPRRIVPQDSGFTFVTDSLELQELVGGVQEFRLRRVGKVGVVNEQVVAQRVDDVLDPLLLRLTRDRALAFEIERRPLRRDATAKLPLP